MINDSLFGQMFSLVLPITIQSFMLSLVSATDAMMLGLLDQTSLSSVSLASQVQFVLSLFVSGVAIGLGIMAAQYYGKGDIRVIEKVTPIALRVNIAVGLVFSLGSLFAPSFLMNLLTNDSDLILCGSDYLRAVSASYLLCALSQVYLSVFKNIGMTKEASYISSFAVVFNIFADGILIFGLFGLPALGIKGAAIATVLARAIELAWSMILLGRRKLLRVRYDLLFERFGTLEKDFWFYTGPVVMASLVWGIAYELYTVIMGHLGSDAVAAYSITSIAKQLASCLVKGLGSGTAILIGNILGANKLDLAKEYGRKLVWTSFFFGIGTGLIILAASPLIVRYASMSDVARSYLKGMLVISAINVVGQSVNITVLDGIFCAGGDSRFDMYGNIGAMWCFAVPFGFIAAFLLKWHVLLVFVIVNLDEFVKMPAVFARYRRYIWLNNITRDDV